MGQGRFLDCGKGSERRGRRKRRDPKVSAEALADLADGLEGGWGSLPIFLAGYHVFEDEAFSGESMNVREDAARQQIPGLLLAGYLHGEPVRVGSAVEQGNLAG